MVKKYLREAAARARAARHASSSTRTQLPSTPEPSGPISKPENTPPTLLAPNRVDSETDSDAEGDCGYIGGVNCDVSEGEYDPKSDNNWVDSDGDLMELEGDELEENLRGLREKEEMVNSAATPSSYDLITEKRSAKEWKEAEKNRSLGYTGTSARTRQRKSKAAREQAAVRKNAKSS
jgi:hypothetical protein